jgi:hypothetical protein
MFIEGINNITSTIRSNANNNISGIVEKITNGIVTIRTPYGNISVQTNEKFVVNQSISVGVSNIPDRENFIKLTLTVDAIKNISDKKTFEFILNKNQQMDLEKRAEISKAAVVNIEEKSYNIELTSKEGRVTTHVFKISDSNQAAQIFSRDGKILINMLGSEFFVLNPSNEIFRIINEIPRNIIIQSSTREKNHNRIQKKHQIDPEILEALSDLTIDNDKDTIEERLWKIARAMLKHDDVELIEGFKVFYLPVLNNHTSSFIRFFVSENSAKTKTHFSKRFIIEFIKDGFRNLLDCLFSDNVGKKRIDMVVRMEKELDREFRDELVNVFNKTINCIMVEGVISFSTQMILNKEIQTKDILS